MNDLKTQEYRDKIKTFESELSKVPGVMFGDCYPLKHSFADGLYIREITVPKGHIVVTKIHKYSHPVFLMKGEVSVIEEGGAKKVKAPFSFITPAGTKRICYTNEETVWTTVHATKETKLEAIEEEIIAKTFDEIDDLEFENILKLTGNGGLI